MKQHAEFDLSVVICCFNSAARLLPTLQHLLAQKSDDAIRWEVVVVDNASTDATAAVARAAWPASHRIELRVVEESARGQSSARRAGCRAARGAVVSFVDDDNWVCEDWVRRGVDILAAHPEVVACGGRGVAVFEGPEPRWFGRYQNAFAVGPQAPEAGYVSEERGYLYGAGLTVRRDALLALYQADFQQLNRGRVSKSLVGGEDVELCMALRLAGSRLYYDPNLVYRHFMPAGRLKLSYLRRLQFANGIAASKLEHYTFVLRNPGPHRSNGGTRFSAARECYWAALRVIRMISRKILGGRHPSVGLPDFLFLLGALWGSARSLREFAGDRAKVLALAERLQARPGQ